MYTGLSPVWKLYGFVNVDCIANFSGGSELIEV